MLLSAQEFFLLCCGRNQDEEDKEEILLLSLSNFPNAAVILLRLYLIMPSREAQPASENAGKLC